MAQSYLEVEGLYVPGYRFSFTNITEEDFTSYWAKVPIVVKPRETIEISDITPIPGPSMGHNLALKMTKELVDRIIIKMAKEDEIARNQPYYRSPQASSLGVPSYRKTYEDQILRKMDDAEESPAMAYMRQQLKQEILGEVKNEQTQPVAVPASLEEFAEIKRFNEKVKEEVKAPVKTKKIGRPKKSETTNSIPV